MARKEIDVTIAEDGRDKGKVFHLTEMPAAQADKWGIRAVLAIARSGVPIPDEFMNMGIVGALIVGVHRLGGIAWGDMEPLLDEMMACVQIMPDPKMPTIIRHLFPNDIEEVSTYTSLRQHLMTLHTGFTPPAGHSIFQGVLAGEKNQSRTRTSRRQSAPSSPQG